jgi:hypothetical protein
MTSQATHLIRLGAIALVSAFAQVAHADTAKSPSCPKDYWQMSAAATNAATREVIVLKAGQSKPSGSAWVESSLCFSSTTGDVVLVEAAQASATTASMK